MNIISNYPSNDNNENKGWKYYLPLSVMMVLMFIGMVVLAYLVCSLPDYFTEDIEVIGEPLQHVQEFVVPQAEAQEEAPEPVIHLTDDDILACIVMSEAGNQNMLGRVAVVATVLNRCDYYDMTVESVVTAPNQYSYPYYGKVDNEAYRAVEIARNSRDLFPADMMWFRAGTYHNFGVPYMQIGDHYFSTLEKEKLIFTVDGIEFYGMEE